MNRNVDGSSLSRDDLVAIAKGAGVPDKAVKDITSACKGSARTLSDLLDVTRQARLDLFNAGKLNLDTRTSANSPGSF